MDLYHAFAICVVISLAFVVDSTIKLYKYRKKEEISQLRGPARDFAIIKDPTAYNFQEARLVIRSWLSCLLFLILLGVFYFMSPDDVRPGMAAAINGQPVQTDVNDGPGIAQ